MQRRNQDALIRIRTAVVNQEQALAEQMAQRKAFKPGGVDADEHMAMYQEEFKGAGGFAGADPKKRRGVSLPKKEICLLLLHYFLANLVPAEGGPSWSLPQL